MKIDAHVDWWEGVARREIKFLARLRREGVIGTVEEEEITQKIEELSIWHREKKQQAKSLQLSSVLREVAAQKGVTLIDNLDILTLLQKTRAASGDFDDAQEVLNKVLLTMKREFLINHSGRMTIQKSLTTVENQIRWLENRLAGMVKRTAWV